MIQIAICDDEKIFIDNLYRQLSYSFHNLDFETYIYTYQSAAILLDEFDLHKFDVVFLDIDMPSVSGFDAAKRIREISPDTKIIFVTSKHDLVYNSFEYQPFYFIRKRELNELFSELEHVAKKLLSHFRQSQIIHINDSLAVNREIPIRNIIYIKSEKHYLLYYTVNADISHPPCERGTLSAKENSLTECGFIKPHQRYLINMSHIKSFETSNNIIIMSDNTKIPISKNLKPNVLEQYRIYKRR